MGERCWMLLAECRLFEGNLMDCEDFGSRSEGHVGTFVGGSRQLRGGDLPNSRISSR